MTGASVAAALAHRVRRGSPLVNAGMKWAALSRERGNGARSAGVSGGRVRLHGDGNVGEFPQAACDDQAVLDHHISPLER